MPGHKSVESARSKGLAAWLALGVLLVPINSGHAALAAAEPAALLEPGAREIKYPTEPAKAAPCVVWADAQVKPRAALLCIHGLGLHKGTFQDFGQKMAKAGVITYAIDMRSFGEFVEQRKHPKLDFDGCLADTRAVLEQIHKEYPAIPVVILGESMGGAIALRATALYPQLISGLISSVPAGDRFSLGTDAAAKVGLSAIFRGFNKPVENVGEVVVEHATKKPELRSKWMNDPLVRLKFTPRELLEFNSFMKQNFEVASAIKDTPILFIQGANDKLVRPAGTWKLFDRLASANKQLVLSKTSEHLIFEEGQFSDEDFSFVTTWIDRNVAPLPSSSVASTEKLPTVASADRRKPGQVETPTGPGEGTPVAVIPKIATPPHTISTGGHMPELAATAKINYWIELYRDGKIYRCNNKMAFRSGDLIRFHLVPETDGYAYLVLRKGTSGKGDVLFPHPPDDVKNFLTKGQDYAIPAASWLEFDNMPGTENLSMLFSPQQLQIAPDKIQERYVTCYVSPEASGAKDLVPTRVKLSWDNPDPVLIPDDFAGTTQITHRGGRGGSSLVRISSGEEGGILAAEIGLIHQ